MPTKHFSTCSLCEATCGIVVETEGRRVLKIYGDEEDVFSKGYICPKAAALQDLYEDPDRLWEPVKRTANGWKTLSWESAFDEVVAGIKETQAKHGRNAMSFYQGNPSVHSLGIMTIAQLFLRGVRTRNRFSATSADQLPHMLAAQQMFGNQLRMPVPDIDRTDFFVVIGGNPLVSNGSIMTAPGMKHRLAALKERGGTLVVVDPRRTQTAAAADQHVFIRPGTDAYFLFALVHTLFEDGLVRLGRVGEFTDGVLELQTLARDFAPEAVQDECGVSAEVIRDLARGAASAERPVFYGRLGACTQEFGGLAAWLFNVLNVLLGALDEPGGAMFSKPAFDLPGLAGRLRLRGHYDKYRSRVRNLPEFGGELPVATMADEMLTEGEGQIRALMTVAGNPVLSTPNGKKLDRALAGLDFMVSVDPFINETTRHANIILPPTTPLERDHYDVAFGMFMVRNNAKFAPAVVQRQAEQRHDWEIFAELWSRWQQKGGPLGKAKAALLRTALLKAGPRAVVATALRTGPYRLSLKKLLQAPHGLDLGPLEPALPKALDTDNKRIALTPQIYRDDVRRLRSHRDTATEFPLRLIGRRHLRSNNSWLHNSKRLVKGKDRCTLLVHPEDASALGLEGGASAVLESAVAKIVVPIELDENIMPGVVSLPHGWGHGRKGARLEVAQAHSGVSMNDVTDDAVIDELSGAAVLNGVPVRLVPRS